MTGTAEIRTFTCGNLALAEGTFGLEEKRAPTLAEYAERFMEASR